MKNQILQQKLIRLILVFFAIVWFLGVISPCFNLEFIISFYPFQKQFFSPVCHQNPAKSFICNHLPFLVCARCTGIYAGTLFSASLLTLYSKLFIFKTKYLIILSVPMLLDATFLKAAVYNYNLSLSAITGFLFGSSVFLYILSAIENLLFIKQK